MRHIKLPVLRHYLQTIYTRLRMSSALYASNVNWVRKKKGCQTFPGEKLISTQTLAFERGEMKAVAFIDASIRKRQNAHRAKRNSKKEREAAMKAQMGQYAFQNLTADPRSDDEGS